MPFPTLTRDFCTRFKSHPIATLIICIAAFGAIGSGLKYLDDDAQRQKMLKPKDRSLLAKVNPFLAAPSPTPTPQLSKEYIYAGSRLLAVEDANAIAAPPADLAYWLTGKSTGTWYVMGGTGSQQTTQTWGQFRDIPVPGDYDGDGKTDFSVFRPSDHKWYVMYSSDASTHNVEFGVTGDKPAPADYDGDGKTDMAIYRPDGVSAGYDKWYVLKSSDGGTLTANWGVTSDVPVPADHDGDGKADFTVWRGSSESFYSIYSSNSSLNTIGFDPSNTLSLNSAKAVSGDYDGDGKSDFAVRYDASWLILATSTRSFSTTTPSGDLSSDIPVQNDYDGDGKCDIAVYRPINSPGYTDEFDWYIRQSASSNSLRIENWGARGAIPVPAYYRR